MHNLNALRFRLACLLHVSYQVLGAGNLRLNEPMSNWTINGRFVGQPVGGVQRYAEEIVRSLDRRIGRSNAFRRLNIDIAVPTETQVSLDLANIPVRRFGRTKGPLWEQTELPFRVSGGLLSLANSGPILKSPHIVCLHDANTRSCKRSYTRPFRTFYGVLHPALGRTASRIATVSNFSAGELLRYRVAVDEKKVLVAPGGHEHALGWKAAHTCETRCVAGRGTIVAIGSTVDHKNIAMLVALAPRLAQEGLQLAIVGAANPRVFASIKPTMAHVATNVHWLGTIADNALAALLQDCLCLAFPSLAEGFGLPPIEAMALGCPVVVSNCASLPEVCGGAALYASPDTPEIWLQHFRRLKSDCSFRSALIKKGKIQASNFRWDATASIYLDAMSQLDIEPSGAH